MGFLIFLLVVVVVLIIPIKLAATWVGAQNTGVMSCLLALILAAAIQKGFSMVLPGVSENLGLLIGIPLASFAYMLVLGTTFIKGIIIAVIQGVLTILIVVVLAGVLPDAAM
jgi:hypothetical protein